MVSWSSRCLSWSRLAPSPLGFSWSHGLLVALMVSCSSCCLSWSHGLLVALMVSWSSCCISWLRLAPSPQFGLWNTIFFSTERRRYPVGYFYKLLPRSLKSTAIIQLGRCLHCTETTFWRESVYIKPPADLVSKFCKLKRINLQIEKKQFQM